MTTYDERPQSRRAAREAERHDAVNPFAPSANPSPAPEDTVPRMPAAESAPASRREARERAGEAPAAPASGGALPFTPPVLPQPPVAAPQAPVAPQATPQAAPAWNPRPEPADEAPFEQTMSRRELRALREAQEGRPSEPETAASAPGFAAPTAAPSTPGVAAPAASPAGPPPVPPSWSPQSPTAAAPTAPAAPAAPEPDPFSALFGATGSPPPLVEPQAPAAPSSAPAPEYASPPPVAPQSTAAPAPQAAAAPEAPEAPRRTIDERHWSRQAELDDVEQGVETTITRSVRGGHSDTVTSALVLPENHVLMNPMSGTGEVYVTGMIALPDALVATGMHPQHVDQSHLDHLLDPGDEQVTSTGTMPVSASSVAAQTGASTVMVAPRAQRGNKVLTGLIIAAGVLAVAVVGLVTVLIVTGQL
ncbi:MAG: hypothetical protein J0G30_11080 [Actinomycetales bacterium]|nr:hypothetical protein [Actinomycetales bacterium]